MNEKHGKRYTPAEVARVKAAVELGIPSHVIEAHTGIRKCSINLWRSNVWREDIAADPRTKARIIAALRGE